MTIYTDSDAYDDEKFPATSKRKRYFKQDEKGVGEMCEIMQEVREEGRLEGQREGIKALIETCRDFKMSIEATKAKIMEKLALDDVEAEKLMKTYW